MKNIVLISVLAFSTSLFATAKAPETFTVTTEEISTEYFKMIEPETTPNKPDPTSTIPDPTSTINERAEQVGNVIGIGKDMVALGEAIYELVKKGKPTNTTEYAPISVVPRDPVTKEYFDPFELENFSTPVEKNFVTKIKNSSGTEVVSFEYKVIYSHGGSLNGIGKYLTSVMIVPASVRTTFGWDFNASMKLGGIMNNGTKANPVAGVIINLKYQINSWSVAYERTDSIYINGRGEMKNMNK